MPAIITAAKNSDVSENPVKAIANAADITIHALKRCCISILEVFMGWMMNVFYIKVMDT